MSQTIAIAATVKRERQGVWALFNEPRHIVNWNFASDDWHCPRAENDLRVGGKLCYHMAAKDGSFAFDYEAVYDAVIHDCMVAYTLGDGRKVETRFEDAADGTRVTTVFEAETQNSAELQRAGWQAILDTFKHYAESS